MIVRWYGPVLAGMLLFTAGVLWINRDIFRQPMIEYADFAANALQVQQAKTGHELLGNYSRFGFHHPGPAFFYMMAAGEYLFYDWTHLVPAPFNAELLACILFNCALLTVAILIVRSHFPGPLLPAFVIAFSVWFVSTVNLSSLPATGLRGAIVSPWMPHMLLMPFILLLTATASAAAGRTGHLPVAAFAAGLLIHGHVGQLLFAPVILAAGFWLWWRNTAHREVRAIGVSAAVLAVFLAPIVLEWAIHRPNNIDAIRAFRDRTPGLQKTVGQSVYYFASFLAHDPSPHTDLLMPDPPLWQSAFSRAYSRDFLIGCGLLLVVAIPLAARSPARRFVTYAAGAVVLSSVLFLIWGVSITGDLYQFNGFFIFGLQWLVPVLALGLISESGVFQAPARPLLTACAAAALVLLYTGEMHHSLIPGDVRMRNLALSVAAEKPAHPVLLKFTDWGVAVGTASQMRRLGVPFCVTRDWAFMFANVCGATELTLDFSAKSGELPATLMRSRG